MNWFTKLFTKELESPKTRWAVYQIIDIIIKNYYDTDEEKACARGVSFSNDYLDKLSVIQNEKDFVENVVLILDTEIEKKIINPEFERVSSEFLERNPNVTAVVSFVLSDSYERTYWFLNGISVSEKEYKIAISNKNEELLK